MVIRNGHASVSSEDPSEAGTFRRVMPAPGRAVLSHVEHVPNYVRKRAPRAPATRVELAGVTPLVAPEGAVVSAAAGSFGTTSTMEVVVGDDDRTVVPDPLDLPWRHICALRIRSQSGQEYVGTGWFIGSTTVMTAGHCVFLHDDGGWPASIAVIPALNGHLEPYGQVVATRFRATEGWTKRHDTSFDYGAILLEHADFVEPPGSFSFGAFADTDLLANDANISGYPYDLDRATRQYFHARRISSVSPQRLFYEIDTYGGQSGSPIWFNLPDGQRVAIGIHTTGSTTSNSGTRITPEVHANMQLWTAKGVAAPEHKANRTRRASTHHSRHAGTTKRGSGRSVRA